MTHENDQSVASLEEQRLIKAAQALGPAHAPSQDLWPAIEHAIKDTDNHRRLMPRWMPYAMAASILLTVISLGFSTNLYLNQIQTNTVVVTSNSYIDAIEQPYILARTSYLEEIVVHGQELSPEIRVVLKDNLQIIDEAIADIYNALAQDPDDKQLIDKLIQIREQEMGLFRQLTKRRISTI